jgi:uncharacterized protein YajQ (UPF0234 family)
MPSFDIVSEVDRQEVDNAVNQARKELATRFDFKNANATIDNEKGDKIKLAANDPSHLKPLLEMVLARLAKRNIDLRNVERKDPAVSNMGHATQELVIKHGIEGAKAKEIIQYIKAQNLKVQSQLQDTQVRVTGKKRDDLQAVIQVVRAKDFGVGLGFTNFRE